jgi:hypothetical protein
VVPASDLAPRPQAARSRILSPIDPSSIAREIRTAVSQANIHQKSRERRMNMTMNTTMNMKMRRRKDFKDKGVSLFASTLIRLLIIKTLTSAARLFLMKQIYNSLNQLETKGQILAPNSNVKTASLYPTSDFIPRLTSSQSVS